MDKRIFVVDDLAIARKYLLSVLNKIAPECQVFSFSNAQETLQHLEQGIIPDLIFLDQVMPKMNGFELVSLIRRNPKFRKIAIAMVTAEQTPDDFEKSKALGCIAFVVKPFNALQIRDVLNKSIALKNSESNQPEQEKNVAQNWIKKICEAIPNDDRMTHQKFLEFVALFVSLKKESMNYGWTELALTCQFIESNLTSLSQAQREVHPKTQDALVFTLEWIAAQLTNISEGQKLDSVPIALKTKWNNALGPELPSDVKSKIREFKQNIEAIQTLNLKLNLICSELKAKLPNERGIYEVIETAQKISEKLSESKETLDLL